MKASGQISWGKGGVSITVRGGGKIWRKSYSSLEQAASEAENLALITSGQQQMIVTGERGPNYPEGMSAAADIDAAQLPAHGFVEMAAGEV